MQGDDPPSLPVGTAVSAKYKGAFCEAKVSKVVRIVKCKVTYKMGLGTATVSDEQIKGTLRVGQSVQAKHPEKKDYVDATIAKIQDYSQYTVVFDDGDITTLRRTALCLKSGRHFNESETLDQLPLTHPEHFGNPVMGGRGARGRRSRQLKEDSSEGEPEEENEPDLEIYSADIGRVVSVESGEKKRNKDNWFPGVIVMPSAQPTVKINVKDEFLVRSFKDGRYYTVPKKEVSEFTREMGARVESNALGEAVEKAIKYLDEDELPIHWEKNSLFNTQHQYTDSEENFTDSSDDEPREEKDHFVAQLYKFMDDSGTPLNKSPMIGSRDVDLYRLFRIVHKLGGYNRVTNQNKWRTVTLRLKLPNSQNIFNQVKMVHKKCLFSYEAFYRTLGCTMSDHTRSAKKNRGRSLIRDKDRVTPVQSPRPEKDETPIIEQPDKKEKEKEKEKDEEEKSKVKKVEVKKNEEKKDEEKKRPSETNDTNIAEPIEQVEAVASTSRDNGGRPKRIDTAKVNKDKKAKAQIIEKPKVPEKIEEVKKEEKEKEKEDEKVQQTRSKGLPIKPKEVAPSPERKPKEPPVKEIVPKPGPSKVIKKALEEDKKRGRKRINTDDKSNSDSASETTTTTIPVNVGDKLKVFYGPTHESKAVTYEAKVIEIDSEAQGPIYMVHYTGWNTRYDEWITQQRIAENLSATTKAKRLKGAMSKASTSTSSTTPTPSTSKLPSKRGRGISLSGKASTSEPPRSTTPSSITSSSSRTKSPATPVTTRNSRLTRQGEHNRRTRRISVQTDVSIQSDSDSEGSESESEQSRTRSSNKSEDHEAKPVRKKLTKTKGEKRKEDDDTEKEEEIEKPKKTPRKLKKSLEPKPTDESDDDTINLPKGRDFDLNQIRSELKGIAKLKVHSTESSEKDTISSDDSINIPDTKQEPEEIEVKKEKIIESTSSSEDIYEFKEPEPFEFESHKIADDKNKKRFVPRILDNIDKSPKKKSPKSSAKKEVKEIEEKKKFKSLSAIKKEDDEGSDKELKVDDIEDPFDKLVESPSFHIGKSTTEKADDYKKVSRILNIDSPLVLFKELPLTMDDDPDERLDISDNDDAPNEPLFTHKEQLFTNSPFSKSSPNSNIDLDCVGFTTPISDDRKPTTSDDEDLLETTMKNVLSFDNDSNDALLINQPSITYESPKEEDLLSKTITLNRVESEDESKTSEMFIENKDTQEKIAALSRQIAPVFQESDSDLLKDLYVPQFSIKPDSLKDITIKTGTKIADSILQKFSMIKNKEPPSPVKQDQPTEKDDVPQVKHELHLEVQLEESEEKEISEILENAEEANVKIPEDNLKTPSPKEKMIESTIKSCEKSKDLDLKKRTPRKVVSKEFIEDSDTDSSDSDERLIMDEDSQTSMSLDMKPDIKESDSNTSFSRQDHLDMDEPQRNFKFDTVSQSEDVPIKEDVKMDIESSSKEEPDSHSLLWCEETIPGSPAPPTTEPEVKPKKNELEMPFASVPCSSTTTKSLLSEIKTVNKERTIPPPLAVNMDNQENRDASSAVLDNTPPTTPESTLSNLSPRGENGDLSPNTADNDSCKSTEAETDYPNLRRGSSNKVSPYSEEDTLMNSESGSVSKRSRDDIIPSPCKKRRRSCKADDVPVKRGRKPINRSRHNSDSDDTSEHSVQGNTSIALISSVDTRLNRSPRPSKYNFFVEFDPSLDSSQRIAVLQQKLTELRKTYADVKAELATIERRRKKIRRREREAKANKQEMACT